MAGTANSGGRNRKSEGEHKLQGTYQRVRHEGSRTPEAPAGVPVVPKELAGDALEEWGRMIGRMTALGTLSSVDDAALYQYCKLFAQTERLEEIQSETAASIDLLEDNLSGLESSELVQCFQEITKLRQLEAGYDTKIRQGRMAVRQYLVEFGMTPSARTRVRLPEQPKADPFKEFGVGPVN